MNSHKNAPLTPKGREAMVQFVEAGLSKTAAARQFNTTPKTVAKWVERFRAGGVDGLLTVVRKPSPPVHRMPWSGRSVIDQWSKIGEHPAFTRKH
jgi:transposase-like protein